MATGLVVLAAGQGVARGVLVGGLILLLGLVVVSVSETYEEIRLARRRAKPRRRPPRPVSELPYISLEEHVPPELRTEEHSQAA